MGLAHFLKGTTPQAELFEHLLSLSTQMKLGIGFAECESPEFNKAVASTALSIVTRAPLGMQTINSLIQRMAQESDRPAPYLAASISSSFLLGVVLLFEYTSKYSLDSTKLAAAHLQMATMEGTILGFFERQHFRVWTPTYKLPNNSGSFVMDFENARTRYGTGVRELPDF